MQRVLLLVSANNGLTQRAALALRAAGHSVRTAVAHNETTMHQAVAPRDFDIIICPFLKHKIPSTIYTRWNCVIVHPGPVGDRGPSALDWAIMENSSLWGVTALGAVEDMDAGPIWAHRSFAMPARSLRKTAVYNGPTADAAVECILEVAAKSAQPGFAPPPASEVPKSVQSARLRPLMRQADRTFTWETPAAEIVRRIAAGDGFPGTLATLDIGRVFLYDAHLDEHLDATPGTVVSRRHHALRIAGVDGSVWIGYARLPSTENMPTFKLPAAQVFASPGSGVAIRGLPTEPVSSSIRRGYREIRYRRTGDVGYLTFDFYNGAMNTQQCQRLEKAFRFASTQDTKVIVLRGDGPYFSNGIHLNTIEAASHQGREAWANITAMNKLCRSIITCSTQVVIGAFTGNAGAGGVMLPLGADVTVARDGTVLNPHYDTMGLFGSELHTYTLPKRVGTHTAIRLLGECLPLSATGARDMGLVDEVGPAKNDEFDAWLSELAQEHASEHRWGKALTAKADRLTDDFAAKPLDAYEAHELGEMAQDMFENRNNFHEKRHAFVHKLPVRAS